MEVSLIEAGLWRWTTAHPAWRSDADWPRDVGCVYFEAADAVVLIDPLVPVEDVEADRFWRALDRDVQRLERDVVVLTTCGWHDRSAAEIVARYAARGVGPAQAGAVTLPEGVIALQAPVADEVLWWLEPVRTLVPGDTVLGVGGGEIDLCPADWLDSGGSVLELARQLAPALALPIERVLTSHGEPVLTNGAAAFARAIARTAS